MSDGASGPPKGCAPQTVAGTRGAETAQDARPNQTVPHDPREIQGIATGRDADQRPPRWAEPPQTAAMAMLERLWGRR